MIDNSSSTRPGLSGRRWRSGALLMILGVAFIGFGIYFLQSADGPASCDGAVMTRSADETCVPMDQSGKPVAGADGQNYDEVKADNERDAKFFGIAGIGVGVAVIGYGAINCYRRRE